MIHNRRRSTWAHALCGAMLLWCVAAENGVAENSALNFARASITTGELKEHAEVLADDTLEGREAGSRGGRAAAKYIIGSLKEAGIDPAGLNDQYTQPFSGNFQNLLAVIPGTDVALGQEYIVVGAHYDHVGYGNRRNSYGPWGFIHNGADDNASGVAALLEVIDGLSRSTWRPRRSILFAFWDAEEKGLLGSKHWVSHPTVPLSAVRLAINIDMVGRLTDGRIEVGGTRSGLGFRRLMSSTLLEDNLWLDYAWELEDNSDHWTFFQAGIPSLFAHTGVHDDYHRPSDDAEKLNVEGIGHVSRYLLEQITKLADEEQLPQFRAESRSESNRTRKRYERPLPNLPPRVGLTWSFRTGDPAYLLVKRVLPRTAAWQAGVRNGDEIVAVNGLPIVNESVFPAVVLQANSEVRLTVRRKQFGQTDAAELQSIDVALTGRPIQLGLSWREDQAEPGSVYVTRVIPYSPASRAGVAVLDRIYAVQGEPILGTDDLMSRIQVLLDEQAAEVQLLVESRGKLQEVSIPLELPLAETDDRSL